MARKIEKLAPINIPRIKEPGMYPDGGGLYLCIKSTGRKSWVFRYKRHGKLREMGLGAVNAVTLGKARQKATDCREKLADGIDPISNRKAEEHKEQLELARQQTFKQCAEAYIESNRAAWRNPKSETQWRASLETYAYPIIGHLPVQDVDINLVLKILEQKKDRFKGKKFWEAYPETANRVRTRIEAVLDWATVRTYRTGENPARWRGHLESLLPNRSKLKSVKHHAALPYAQIGDFIQELRKQEANGAAAFELLILTASRTSEVLKARWDEFDLENSTWAMPGNRTKSGREHRVPLSPRALEILRSIEPKQGYNKNSFVFPGQRQSKPLSKMGLLYVLKNMGFRKTVTVHGFRSTFRDWCAEQTAFAYEVGKAALAHKNRDKVEASYLRTDYLDKRRKLMDAWAEYCSTPSAKNINNVVALRALAE